MTAYVFRPRRRRGGKSKASPTWWLRYRLNPTDPILCLNLRVRDRQVADQKLNEFVREKQWEAAKIIAPKALRDGAAKLMTHHLDEFAADLKAVGRSKGYVYNTRRLVSRLLSECGWSVPSDVTVDSFVAWRAKPPRDAKRGNVLSPKSLNEYLGHANALLNWMKRQGRIAANPLAAVAKVEQRGREVRKPRALSDAEVTSLLAAAGERRTLYLTALLTGLRRGELRQLQWGDVHLDAPRPFINARAATTKNKKAAVLWLRDDLAAVLRTCRPDGVGAGVAVFKRLPDMEEFRSDLIAAGISTKADAAGRWVLFHSLRHTLDTSLARAGVSQAVAMVVMRHSDPRLTLGTYLDKSQLPTADALDHLPRWEDNRQSERAIQTGTGGTIALQELAESDAQKDAHEIVPAGHRVSHAGMARPSAERLQGGAGEQVRHALSPEVTVGQDVGESWGTRIRT